ncbi:MAG: SUMF1/EgtB/PvdO family nonheme iron enzyme [Polyangiaceae bacterium]|nr:SUMF1/EgtB/PvdO family nonheme iron enzyme [Polyangiaceae bacterium]
MNRALVIGLLAVLSAACGGQTEDSAATAPTWPKTGCPPGTDLVDGRCRVREIYVPGGTFTMGRGYCPVAGVHQLPPSFEPCPLADTPHEITVAPFWMEATLRTWSHYEDDPGCPSQELECAQPKAYMPLLSDIAVAQPAYDGPGTPSPGDQICGEEGKRHIDEAQWEWAATWGGTRTYPWGEAPPTCELANIDATKCPPKVPWVGNDIPEVSAAGSYPPSPEGIYDLAGNAGEVVGIAPYAYTDAYTSLPTHSTECPSGQSCSFKKVLVLPVRGGGTGGPLEVLRAAHRGGGLRYNDIPGYGYRCVRPVE